MCINDFRGCVPDTTHAIVNGVNNDRLNVCRMKEKQSQSNRRTIIVHVRNCLT